MDINFCFSTAYNLSILKVFFETCLWSHPIELSDVFCTMQKQFVALTPGIGISILIALIAKFSGQYVPMVGATLLALLLGTIAGNTFMNDSTCAPGLKFIEKYVLEASIVLSGFGLQAVHLKTMGNSILWLLVIMVFTTFALSWILGKVFTSSNRFSYLLGAGSAICGSSAIAATAPIIEASEEETGLALGLVNALGLLGLVGLPLLAHTLDFSTLQSATLIGGTLQSLGHVVASGHTLGEDVGHWAVIVKMGRILFMVPLLLILFFLKRSSDVKRKAKFPMFIAWFVAAILISQVQVIPTVINDTMSTLGKWLLIVAMGAIGAKIRLTQLVKISKKGILHGITLFFLQILIAVLLIALFV